MSKTEMYLPGEIYKATSCCVDGKYEQAIKHFKKVMSSKLIKTFPREDLSELHRMYAQAYFMLKDHDNAREQIETAIRYNKKNVYAWILKGNINMDLGDFTEAYNAYKEAEEYSPNNVLIMSNIGGCLVKSGSFEEGKQYLKKVNELDPTHPAGNSMYAELIYKEKPQEALKIINNVLANGIFGPENPHYYHHCRVVKNRIEEYISETNTATTTE